MKLKWFTNFRYDSGENVSCADLLCSSRYSQRKRSGPTTNIFTCAAVRFRWEHLISGRKPHLSGGCFFKCVYRSWRTPERLCQEKKQFLVIDSCSFLIIFPFLPLCDTKLSCKMLVRSVHCVRRSTSLLWNWIEIIIAADLPPYAHPTNS